MPLRLRHSGRVSPLLIGSVLANFALAGGIAYLFLQPAKTPPALTSPANRIGTGDTIQALGRVQPISGVINLFGPPGDQIAEWKVQLGSPVKPGEVLARLRGSEERQRSLSALDAQIAEAQKLKATIERSSKSKLDDLRLEAEQALKSGKFDIEALDAKIVVLREAVRLAQAEINRGIKISEGSQLFSQQERDQANLKLVGAKQELEGTLAQKAKAEQLKASAEATLNTKVATLQAETERGLAQVPLTTLQASRSVAEQKVLDAELKAPITGRVVKLGAKVGETLTTMPVLQVADTSEMVVVAEVYETDIPKLREWLAKSGQPVTVNVDARILGSDSKAELSGTTTAERIAPMIAKNTVFALGPREDADRRVVEVEVLLNRASSQALSNFIGLQVRVTFQPPK